VSTGHPDGDPAVDEALAPVRALAAARTDRPGGDDPSDRRDLGGPGDPGDPGADLRAELAVLARADEALRDRLRATAP
jgi:hypothetical protein